MFLDAPLLLVAALVMLSLEILSTRVWLVEMLMRARQILKQNVIGARFK